MKRILLLAVLSLCAALLMAASRPDASRPELVLQLASAGGPLDSEAPNDRVAWSPDSKTVAILSRHVGSEIWGALVLVDITSNAVRKRLVGDFNGLSWSPDGKTIAVGAAAGVRFYTAQGDEKLRWRTASPVRDVSYGAGGRLLAVAETNDHVWLRECVNGRGVRLFQPAQSTNDNDDGGGSVALSPDGRWVAYSRGSDLTVWNVGTYLSHPLPAGGSGSPIRFAPLALGGAILNTGTELHDLNHDSSFDPFKVKGRIPGLLTSSLSFSSQGRWMLVEGAAAQLWNLTNGKKQFVFHTENRVVGLSPDARWLLDLGQEDRHTAAPIVLREARTGKAKLTLQAKRWGINVLRFASGAASFITEDDDNQVKQWDYRSGRLLRVLPPLADQERDHAVVAMGESRRVRRVHRQLLVENQQGRKLWSLGLPKGAGWKAAFSADARRMAIGIFSQQEDRQTGKPRFTPTAKIYDSCTGKVLCRLPSSAFWVEAFTPLQGGVLLASGAFWDTRSGRKLGTLQKVPREARLDAPELQPPVFSPDGHRLAMVYSAGFGYREPGGVALISVPDGKILWRTMAHQSSINSLAFSPDGRWIASASDDRTVKIYQAQNGRVTCSLRGHYSMVNGAAFGPDGTLLTCGNDYTVRAWNPPAGRLLWTLRFLPRGNEYIVYAPSGHFDGSPGCGQWIRWRRGSQLFPYARFAHAMHRANLPHIARSLPPRQLQHPRLVDLRHLNNSTGLLPTPTPTPSGNSLSLARAFDHARDYHKARQLYRQALDENPALHYEISLRLLNLVERTEPENYLWRESTEFDDAVAEGEALLQATPWKARVLLALGRLYLKAPPYGWWVGDRVVHLLHRPDFTGEVEPVGGWMTRVNAERVLDYFERAKLAARLEREAAHNQHALTVDEEIQLSFDLAALLPNAGLGAFKEQLDNGTVNDTQATGPVYNQTWSLPAKVWWLYDDIMRLDQTPGRKSTALAMIGKAQFAAQWRAMMDVWSKKHARRPYPLDDIDPAAWWREVLRKFSNSEYAPMAAWYLARSDTKNDQHLIQRLQELIRKYPRTPYATNARATIARLSDPEWSAEVPSYALPEQPLKIAVHSINRPLIALKLFAIRDWQKYFGVTALAQAKHWEQRDIAPAQFIGKSGKPVWQGVLVPKTAMFKWSWSTFRIPAQHAGLYALSTGGKREPKLIFVSSLSLLQVLTARQNVVFVADARSGQPVAGSGVVLQETVDDEDPDERTSRLIQGRTNGLGVFVTSVAADARLGPALAYRTTANRGVDLVRTGSFPPSSYSGGQDDPRRSGIFVYTDRPLYRPGQTAHFRALLTKWHGHDVVPAKNVKAVVLVGGRYRTIQRMTLTSSNFGSISGSFTVPTNIRLGEQQLQVQLQAQEHELLRPWGSVNFNIEEYRRPEYQVTLQPPAMPRIGTTATATVRVKYYFGAPAPGTEIHFIVRQKAWLPQLAPPRPLAWFEPVPVPDPQHPLERKDEPGKIVCEGNATTDDEGVARIEFPVEALPTPEREGRFASHNEDEIGGHESSDPRQPLFEIEAEVTDASRRVVTARSVVKAAAQPFFAFVRSERGFYQAGGTARLEILARDANDQPVSAEGTITVFRRTKSKEAKVSSASLQIENGRAVWEWPGAPAGAYRVEWNNGEVHGSGELWVAGEALHEAPVDGCALVVEQEYLNAGDKARALLVVEKPGTTVFLAQLAGEQVLSYGPQLVRGTSTVVEIPVTVAHQPNFLLLAMLLSEGKVRRRQVEFYAPRQDQTLSVRVTANQDFYGPGEEAKFNIQTRDWRDKPVRADLGLSVFDASLLGLQPDTTPDVRHFFYGAPRWHTVLVASRENEYDHDTIGNEYEEEGLREVYIKPLKGMGLLGLEQGMDWGGLARPPDGTTLEIDDNTIIIRSWAGLEGDISPEEALSRAGQSGAVRAQPSIANLEHNTPDLDQLMPPPRRDFRESAAWVNVVTDAVTGNATVPVTLPDTLTTWHGSVIGWSDRAQVGAAQTEVVTKRDLLVRLEAPRFLVERDHARLSAIVHNNSDSAQHVSVSLVAGGEIQVEHAQPVETTVPPHGQRRLEWDCLAREPAKGAPDGNEPCWCDLEARVRGEGANDAVAVKLPILRHATPTFEQHQGVLPMGADGTAHCTVTLPATRIAGSEKLRLDIAPGVAPAMLGALPFLVDYPYGCVEQTVSRFVPALAAQKVMKDSGLLPKGMPDATILRQLSQDSLDKLAVMERRGGGWGWWPGSEYADPYMTAYVMYALFTVQELGTPVDNNLLSRGLEFLNSSIPLNQSDRRDLTDMAWRCFVISRASGRMAEWMRHPQRDDSRPPGCFELLRGELFDQRGEMVPQAQALLALGLWNIGEKDKAIQVTHLLEKSALEKGGIAYWASPGEGTGRFDDEVETAAWALRTLLKMDPDHRLATPVARWLVWRAQNGHWDDTKATALAVLALADYARVKHEWDAGCQAAVLINGNPAGQFTVGQQGTAAPVALDAKLLHDGDNDITIAKHGRGVLAWNLSLDYQSVTEPMTPVSHQIAVSRSLFKITRRAGADSFARTELHDGDALASGDLLECELALEAANAFDYVVVEDHRPAGLEPLELRSGAAWDQGRVSNVEIRDTHTAFFLDHLETGRRVLKYRLRAETPGTYHALPAQAWAMYAPQMRGAGAELRLTVGDNPE